MTRDTDRSSAPGAEPAQVRFARLRRAFRPLRRLAAWFALVREEESDRKRHVDTRIADIERRLDRTRVDIERRIIALDESLTASIGGLRELLDRGVGARADATLSELWRRMEGADARQATAIQRLAEEVERLREEQDVTNVLLERMGIIPAPAPLETHEMRLRETVHLFRGLGPVVDLMSGGDEFLRAAKANGMEAYGVNADPAAAEAGRELGLDIRIADPLDHLGSLAPESVGGILCADGVGRLTEDRATQLVGDAARALRPGGVVVIAPQVDPSGRLRTTMSTFARSVVEAGLAIHGTTRCAAGDRDQGRPALVARKPA